jgi:hypothetical protein
MPSIPTLTYATLTATAITDPTIHGHLALQ